MPTSIPAALQARFRIGAELWSGSSGALFEATEVASSRTGVLKVVTQAASWTPAERGRLARELEKQATLTHPYLATPLATGVSDDLPWVFRAGVDGLFHVATWIFVVVGSTMSLRAWQEGRLAPPWRRHVGALLGGWGVFNLVEGVINHHLLGIHHVRDDVADPMWWDLGFLALGLALVLAGASLLSLRGHRAAVTSA